MMILKNTQILQMILVFCQFYTKYLSTSDALHASKYDQIMPITSDCEETDASVINEILKANDLDKHEQVEAEKEDDATLILQAVINNINIVINNVILL